MGTNLWMLRAFLGGADPLATRAYAVKEGSYDDHDHDDDDVHGNDDYHDHDDDYNYDDDCNYDDGNGIFES